MIDILFQFGGDVILVKIEGTRISFGSVNYGSTLATIEGLKLNKSGVEKEFPDLKGNPNWREIAIKRFKNKIKELDSEMDRASYIIEDLKKYGYVGKQIQVKGHRPQKLNGVNR